MQHTLRVGDSGPTPIQSATAENRPGNKKRRRRRKKEDENNGLPYSIGDPKEKTTAAKYNGLPYWAAIMSTKN